MNLPVSTYVRQVMVTLLGTAVIAFAVTALLAPLFLVFDL